jgi:hypothetical protein
LITGALAEWTNALEKSRTEVSWVRIPHAPQIKLQYSALWYGILAIKHSKNITIIGTVRIMKKHRTFGFYKPINKVDINRKLKIREIAKEFADEYNMMMAQVALNLWKRGQNK